MTNQRKRLGTGLEKRVVEVAIAAGVKAKKQPLSGVLQAFPNDVQLGDVLAECKVRAIHIDAKGKRILSFDIDWLDNAQRNAQREGFTSTVVIMRPKGTQRLIALLDFDDYLKLLVPGVDKG